MCIRDRYKIILPTRYLKFPRGKRFQKSILTPSRGKPRDDYGIENLEDISQKNIDYPRPIRGPAPVEYQPRIVVLTSIDAAFKALLYVPTGQSVGAALLAGQYWPIGQTWFAIAPTFPTELWKYGAVVRFRIYGKR